jgi:hypothetical protein
MSGRGASRLVDVKMIMHLAGFALSDASQARRKMLRKRPLGFQIEPGAGCEVR